MAFLASMRNLIERLPENLKEMDRQVNELETRSCLGTLRAMRGSDLLRYEASNLYPVLVWRHIPVLLQDPRYAGRYPLCWEL